jgi:hypothetical protein
MTSLTSSLVMPGLVLGIHALFAWRFEDVGGRNKCGHDGGVIGCAIGNPH